MQLLLLLLPSLALADRVGVGLDGVGVLLLGEVLVEEGGELARGRGEALLVGPRRRRVEELRRHARALRRVVQAEVGVDLRRRLRELARVDRVDDRARVLERAPLAAGAAESPGVEEP